MNWVDMSVGCHGLCNALVDYLIDLSNWESSKGQRLDSPG